MDSHAYKLFIYKEAFQFVISNHKLSIRIRISVDNTSRFWDSSLKACNLLCSTRWKRLIQSRGRSFIFSTALPVPVVASVHGNSWLNNPCASSSRNEYLFQQYVELTSDIQYPLINIISRYIQGKNVHAVFAFKLACVNEDLNILI